MIDDETIKARANKAKAELGETEAAFDLMRKQAMDDLIASKPSETAKREQLYHAINTIDTVRAVLLKAVRAGEQADLIAEFKAATADPADNP